MATWLVPRATTSERLGLGAIPDGDLIYDTDLEVLFVGDDTTPGGHRVANNSTITITPGNHINLASGQTGVFTINQLLDQTITIDHAPQGQASAAHSVTPAADNRTVFISNIQADELGHIRSLSTDSVVAANDATITIQAGSGIDLGADTDPDGTFTLNQATNQTIEIDHTDTSTLDGAQTTANQVINSITVDGFGHVTAVNTTTVGAAMIPDGSVSADELDVTGDGTTNQFLRSDGDGSFSWVSAVQNVGAGNGLTGGGAGPTSTVNVGAGTGITVNANTVAVNRANAYNAGTGISINNTNGAVAVNRANAYNSGTVTVNDTNGALNVNRANAYNAGTGISINNNTGAISASGGGGYSVAETIAVNGFNSQVSVLAGDILTPGNTAGRSGNDREPIVRYFTGGMGLYNAAGTATVTLSTDQGQNITASGNVLRWRSS